MNFTLISESSVEAPHQALESTTARRRPMQTLSRESCCMAILGPESRPGSVTESATIAPFYPERGIVEV